jgi:hypothetical protein
MSDSKALQTAMAQWTSVEVMTGRIRKMLEIQQKVMKADKHYMVIPGCKENSLLQSGSQILSMAFNIGHDPEVEDLSTDGEIRYRVRDRVFDRVTGLTITYGVGECSSNEEKYAWRKCGDEEYEAAEFDKRRIKYYPNYSQKQVRTNPADVANTVLKMARKRANVNGTIEATAASEIFTQDIEDLPDGMDISRGNPAPKSSKPDVAQPQEIKGAPDADYRKANDLISEGQEKRIYAICKNVGLDPADLKAYIFDTLGKRHLWELTWKNKEYDKICKAAEGSYKKIIGYAKEHPIPTEEQPETEAQPDKQENKGSDAPSFAETLRGTALQAGLTEEEDICKELVENFQIKTPEDVPPEKMSQVIDHFIALTDK